MADKYSPKDIKMAIGVASDKRYAGGNMTGAVKAIEKIKKGLSSHPQVAAVLKRQNEGKMKTFDDLRAELAEGKAAIAIAKKEKGELSEREDTAAQVARALKKMGMNKKHKETDITKKIPGVLKSMGLNKNIANDRDFLGDVLDDVMEMKEEMDPTDHVKEKDGMFCVMNADGSEAKKFDNKDDADQYAIDNHDKLMATAQKEDSDYKVDGRRVSFREKAKKLGYVKTKDDDVEDTIEGKEIDTKAMSAYQKYAKAKKVDDDSIRMAFDNPDHAETKRMMKDKNFATALQMYKASFVEEGIIGNLVKKTAKAAGGAVVNRLSTAGRAKIAQKKIDKHNTKIQRKDTIAKANAAGKSAFGLTQKSRAANAKKKLDKIAQKKSAQDTIAKAKQLKKGVTAGMEYEGKGMDSAAMKRAMDAFKKRGGKIKKVAPGKAAGYHGKEDPGADIQGMMDRGDTKGFNRKKKVKSMGK